MKTIITALAGASLLAVALPAAAQSRQSGGHHDGGAGPPSSSAAAPMAGGGPRDSGRFGGFDHPGGGFAGGRVGDHRMDGHHFHRHFRDTFFFADFGFGYPFGLSAFDPWYYGYYPGYYVPYGPPPVYYLPPPSYYAPNAAPPPPAASAPQPPAACGAWSWDATKQVYNWVPCPPA